MRPTVGQDAAIRRIRGRATSELDRGGHTGSNIQTVYGDVPVKKRS